MNSYTIYQNYTKKGIVQRKKMLYDSELFKMLVSLKIRNKTLPALDADLKSVSDKHNKGQKLNFNLSLS